MQPVFPYANIIAAILILVIGFGFHFCGQLLSLFDWELACKLGLQERDIPPGAFPYEHGTALGDVAIAWIYPIAAIGLVLNAEWGYALAAIPGAILLYHGVCAWGWEADRRAAGHGLWSDGFRLVWCGGNAATGLLTLTNALVSRPIGP